MGKKINPKVFRLNTTYEHNSKWFASKRNFAQYLREDTEMRVYLEKKFKNNGIANIEFKRSSGDLEIIIYTAKPGVIIGRGGAGAEEIKKEIKKLFFGNKKIKIIITILEVAKPDLSAELLYQNMASQLEKRIPFRRVLKRTIEQAKRAGARGIKVCVSGRLNGAEIARTEMLYEGKIPAHTLRANIDYARGKVCTLYGTIGVKVWVYKGDVFAEDYKKKNSVNKIETVKSAAKDDKKESVKRKPRRKILAKD